MSQSLDNLEKAMFNYAGEHGYEELAKELAIALLAIQESSGVAAKAQINFDDGSYVETYIQQVKDDEKI